MLTEPPALPAYPDETLAGLAPEQLIELLIRDEDRVPRNAIDRCAVHGDAMVERLTTIDDDRAWGSDVLPGEWWLLLHAAMILGLIASESAGLLLVRLMRRMSVAEEGNLQDWLSGYWPALFANKPRPAVEATRKLAEDRALDWYIRCQAVDVVIDAAQRESGEALDRALDWLATSAGDESDDWNLRLSAGNTLLEFPRERHRSLLADLAARQTGFGVHFSAQDVEHAYAKRRDEANWKRHGDPWRFYAPGAIAARQDRWAEEDERERDAFADDDDFPFPESYVPYVRLTEKVGRNDPCPCGSGKKYKRCCLLKEQA